MALKTLIQAEQIVHTLDPMLDITKESFVDIQGFLSDQFTPDSREGDGRDPGLAFDQGIGAPHP